MATFNDNALQVLLYINFYFPYPFLCKALHKKGERIFITAKLPNYIKVGNDDLIEQYLFLTTSHDGAVVLQQRLHP